MSEDPPINWEKGLKNYGGDEDMFRLMIERFEDLTFTQTLESLCQNILNMDFKNIKLNARAIKGASGYLAADNCEKIAGELEKASNIGDDTKVVENFLLLMTAAKALKVYIAKLANKSANTIEFQAYEQKVRNKYSNIAEKFPSENHPNIQNSTFCTGCRIF